MINLKRRTLLKSLSLLTALPAVGFSSLVSAQGVVSHQQQTLTKSVIIVTNLTGRVLTLNKISPVGSLTNNYSVSLSVAKGKSRTLMPGGAVTLDVATIGKNTIGVDQIEIKSDQPEFDGILSVTAGHAQITLV